MTSPKLHFDRTEFLDRIERTRRSMHAHGIDLLILSDPSNMNWLTGYDGWSFYVHQCVIVPLSGEPIWYGRSQDANGALRTCFMDPGRIIGYPDDYVQSTEKHPMEYLSARRKCDLVAEIYDASLRYDPEIGAGGDYPSLVPLLPSGPDASAPHLTWDDAPLKSGEGTFFEIAGVVKRYHCPLSRTVFLGKPTQTFLDAEKAVLEGMEAGLEKARIGNACEDVANAFFGVLKKYGITKDNRAGYPIGVSYPPDWGERTMSLRPGDRAQLRENMTFHFMTGLWMEDWGFEITESIRIAPEGPELLADVPRKLFVKD